MKPQLIQFVCFETTLAVGTFLKGWSSFAQSFVAQGIERIVLAEATRREAPFGFISRNAWPAAQFEATFGGRLPRDAGSGPVMAVQGGAFREQAGAGVDPLMVRGAVAKVMALVQHAGEGPATALQRLALDFERGEGWALYHRDPSARGGTFDSVLEVYVPPEAAPETERALKHTLSQEVGLGRVVVQGLREVFALP